MDLFTKSGFEELASGLSGREEQTVLEYVRDPSELDGYCYLAMVVEQHRVAVGSILGSYPTAGALMGIADYCIGSLDSLYISQQAQRGWHVSRQGECELLPVMRVLAGRLGSRVMAPGTIGARLALEDEEISSAVEKVHLSSSYVGGVRSVGVDFADYGLKRGTTDVSPAAYLRLESKQCFERVVGDGVGTLVDSVESYGLWHGLKLVKVLPGERFTLSGRCVVKGGLFEIAGWTVDSSQVPVAVEGLGDAVALSGGTVLVLPSQFRVLTANTNSKDMACVYGGDIVEVYYEATVHSVWQRKCQGLSVRTGDGTVQGLFEVEPGRPFQVNGFEGFGAVKIEPADACKVKFGCLSRMGPFVAIVHRGPWNVSSSMGIVVSARESTHLSWLGVEDNYEFDCIYEPDDVF